jgi:hypothetical protein
MKQLVSRIGACVFCDVARARASQQSLGSDIQTRQALGVLEFHVDWQGCGGVAPCCDFGILATPAGVDCDLRAREGLTLHASSPI